MSTTIPTGSGRKAIPASSPPIDADLYTRMLIAGKTAVLDSEHERQQRANQGLVGMMQNFSMPVPTSWVATVDALITDPTIVILDRTVYDALAARALAEPDEAHDNRVRAETMAEAAGIAYKRHGGYETGLDLTAKAVEYEEAAR